MADASRNSGRHILQGILGYAMSRLDWRLHILEATDEGKEALARAIRSSVADGAICSALENDRLERVIEASCVPFVAIGSRQSTLPGRKLNLATVTFDEVRIGRTAARHLFRDGAFKSFGFVHHALPFLRHLSRLRARGFAEELAQHGIAAREYVPAGAQDARALADWVAALPKPAAVVIGNDTRAVDFYAACEKARVRIPDDVRVLGIDNDELTCLTLVPSLSSLATDFEGQAAEAAATLDRMIRRRLGPCPRKDVLFNGPITLVARASTSTLPPGIALVRRAEEYIRVNAGRHLSVDDVVAFLRVSKRTAYLRFAQFAEKSILDTINDARIGHVKRKLLTSRQTIESVSAAAGFRSVNHLKALFKKRVGMTMRAWRRQNARGG